MVRRWIHRGLALSRRLLPMFSIMSLVALAVTLVLWFSSLWRCYEVAYHRLDGHRGTSYLLSSWPLRFAVMSAPLPGPVSPRISWWSGYTSPAVTRSGSTQPFFELSNDRIACIGFEYCHRVIEDLSMDVSEVEISHWILVLLFAILPFLHFRLIYMRRRLARLGLCPTCGYDLRASPDRCPECGRVPRVEARPPE